MSNVPDWIDSFDKLNQLFWGYFINIDYMNLTTYSKYIDDFIILDH